MKQTAFSPLAIRCGKESGGADLVIGLGLTVVGPDPFLLGLGLGLEKGSWEENGIPR